MGRTTTLPRLLARTVAAVVLAAGLVGCGASDGAGSGDDGPGGDETSTVGEETSDDESDAGGGDQGSALDQYVERAQADVPALMQQGEGTYSDVTITGSGEDTLVFTYTYLEEVDPDAAPAYFQRLVSTLQELSDSVMFPEMETSGVADPKVSFVYLNPDGAEVWSHTFERTQ